MEIEEQVSKSGITLTLDQRIQALYDAGMTTAASIYRRLIRTVKNVKYDTVARKVRKMKEGVPLTTQRKKRSDVFLTPAVEKEISLYLKDNPFATAKEIIDDLDYDTSKTTMQRALKQMEYFYGSVKKQPLITES